MVCIPLHGCTESGWQNTWESDSQRPRHPEPWTTNSCWPPRAEKWALTSIWTECDKCRKMKQNPPSETIPALSVRIGGPRHLSLHSWARQQPCPKLQETAFSALSGPCAPVEPAATAHQGHRPPYARQLVNLTKTMGRHLQAVSCTVWTTAPVVEPRRTRRKPCPKTGQTGITTIFSAS